MTKEELNNKIQQQKEGICKNTKKALRINHAKWLLGSIGTLIGLGALYLNYFFSLPIVTFCGAGILGSTCLSALYLNSKQAELDDQLKEDKEKLNRTLQDYDDIEYQSKNTRS